MAITEEFLNMDEYFRSTTGNKIIINDLDPYGNDDIETVRLNLMERYDSDILETVPKCDCGKTRSAQLIGTVCSYCSTDVKEPFQKQDPLLWLQRPMLPNKDPDIPLLNPGFWFMLSYTMHAKHDFIRWLTNPTYNPPIDPPDFVKGIKKDVMKDVRSYKNFINNIEHIIIYLKNHSSFKKKKLQEHIDGVLDLYRRNKSKLFSTYLPIVNKKLFVLEKTTKGKYVNLSVAEAIDVIMLWVKETNAVNRTEKSLDKATSTVIGGLFKLYKTYYEKYLLKKTGMFRKHMYGARSPFTFRSVIVTIQGKHDYRELHVPWSIGVTVFKPYIMNKLCNKYGYNFKRAKAKQIRAVEKYDPDIDMVLNELIEESPYYIENTGMKAIMVIAQRNPSLLPGSAQMLGITKFKKNPKDKTIGFPSLSLKAPNADIDGDELNFFLLQDERMVELFKSFQPHYNVPDPTKPYQISSDLSLLDPGSNILSNSLYDESEKPEEDTISSKLRKITVVDKG